MAGFLVSRPFAAMTQALIKPQTKPKAVSNEETDKNSTNVENNNNNNVSEDISKNTFPILDAQTVQNLNVIELNSDKVVYRL